jgi:hypothetical protein
MLSRLRTFAAYRNSVRASPGRSHLPLLSTTSTCLLPSPKQVDPPVLLPPQVSSEVIQRAGQHLADQMSNLGQSRLEHWQVWQRGINLILTRPENITGPLGLSKVLLHCKSAIERDINKHVFSSAQRRDAERILEWTTWAVQMISG